MKASATGYNWIKSIGLRTDCFINKYAGSIEVFENHIVVKTPSNPEYHWGNYIIFKEPPQAGDFSKWNDLFESHFSCIPGVKHKAFTWDNVKGERGVIGPFVEDGFEIDTTIVLTAKAINESIHLNEDLKVKQISKEEEWQAVFNAHLSLKPEGMLLDAYEVFRKKVTEGYKAMVKSGNGMWYVGYLGEELACDLGIFWNGEMGRFQKVFTLPRFRRQGLCTTLVSKVSEYSLKKAGLKTLVLEAEEDYVISIYESVGYKKSEKLVGACQWK